MSRAARRPLWVDILLLGLAATVFVTMLGLGNWQMRRLAWKLDLIEQVEARAFGAPVAAPLSFEDGAVTADQHAYLRVSAKGQFRHDLSRRVKAVTELGPGWWLMTPLVSQSSTYWVNRGFLPSGLGPSEISEPQGLQTVTGLLRTSEPDGSLLEANDPVQNRWYSRDVPALSRDAGLSQVVPYFIDADQMGPVTSWPRGGLTQVSFRNSHLSYALTWYAMALLFLGAMAFVIWDRLRGHDARD